MRIARPRNSACQTLLLLLEPHRSTFTERNGPDQIEMEINPSRQQIVPLPRPPVDQRSITITEVGRTIRELGDTFDRSRKCETRRNVETSFDLVKRIQMLVVGYFLCCGGVKNKLRAVKDSTKNEPD
ncbi:hypothetical protein BsWGS_07562 [Bradybaena similaris]